MKICFVELNIYPCLAQNSNVELIGGSELQQSFIARGLTERGYNVVFISQDFGQPDGEVINNIKIHKVFKSREGIRGIRYFYPRLFKIWKALIKIDADVYYVRGATFLTGILAIFCKIYGKKFICAAAHDFAFIPEKIKKKIRFIRDRLLYKYGLRHADMIIVQSYHQQNLLLENFRLESKVIHNINPHEAIHLPDSERKCILWVSNLRAHKRPFHFIELSKHFPEEEFIMIGGPNPSYNALFNEAKKKAEKYSNLHFLGFQKSTDTEKYFDKCKVFINTSESEGFPNTFLQAWRRGIPVISYVDPDNVIKKNRLGIVIDSEEELQKALQSFLVNHSFDYDQIVEYFLGNHSCKIIDQYCEVLDEL